MATNALALRGENAAAIQPSQVTEVQRLGGLLAASGYFSDAREMAQAAVKVLAGQELGIPPVAAMMGINIIKGKVALGGNLIASRIRAHGYEYRHKQFDSKGCILEFLSKPDANGKRTLMGESGFNEEDAKTAGVFTDMYKKYPRNMYFNRAMSNGAKWYTPEVFAGAPIYVPEELGVAVDEQGDMVHPEPTRPQPQKAQARDEGPKPEAKPEPELSALDKALAGFSSVASIAERFATLKPHFLKVLDVGVWDQIILEHNCDGLKTFGTVGNAKKCFTALWGAAVKAHEDANEENEPQAGAE